MNRHATRFLGALGLVALTVSVPHLAAQEFTWSGTVDGASAVRIADYLDDPDVTGSVTAAVRVRSYIPLGTDGGVELRLRPSYTWSDDRPYLVDVERASADLTLPGVLGAGTVLRGQAGRVPFSAPAPGVLSHTLDAVDLRLSTPLVQARVAGGYSGLLLNPVSDIRMSASDLAEAADDDQFFGPSRAIALGEVSLPEIVLRQTVRVYGIGQWDLRSTDAGEDSLNSFYGGAVVQGPVISGLYHQIAATVSSATSTVEGQSGDTTALGLHASVRLQYYRPDLFGSRVSLSGTLSSGLGGDSDRFVPISRGTVGRIAQLPPENLAGVELSYGFRPFSGAASRSIRDIDFSATGRTLFRVDTDRALDAVGAAASSGGPLVGTEILGRVGWRVLSDLGFAVEGGAFLPTTGSSGSFTSQRSPEYLVSVTGSASF